MCPLKNTWTLEISISEMSSRAIRPADDAYPPIRHRSQSAVCTARHPADGTLLPYNLLVGHPHDGSHPVRPFDCWRGPCPGNDGLLWRDHADDYLQNLRHLCGRSHLLRRTDLRRNSHDVGQVPGRHPRTLWRALWRWGPRLGCWLDWKPKLPGYRPLTLPVN